MSNQNLPSSRSVHSFQFRIAFKWSSFESPSFFVRLLGDFQLAVGPKDFRPPKDLLLAPSSFKRSTPTMPPPQRRWKLGNRCPRYPRTQDAFKSVDRVSVRIAPATAPCRMRNIRPVIKWRFNATESHLILSSLYDIGSQFAATQP
uniref:HDC18269 n=1 Tax=Drosophila melanogaster TaxID=7227 RepID=Q6IIH5_DROME|nr:TPA_inf: HDC18269 [Drosophila melanogaster]